MQGVSYRTFSGLQVSEECMIMLLQIYIDNINWITTNVNRGILQYLSNFLKAIPACTPQHVTKYKKPKLSQLL